MLEKMDDFFAARLDGYDRHMMTEIRGAEEFYPYTASLLPDVEIMRRWENTCTVLARR